MKQIFTISPTRIGSPKNLINPIAKSLNKSKDPQAITGANHSSRDSKLSTANSSINTNANKSMLSCKASTNQQQETEAQAKKEPRDVRRKSRNPQLLSAKNEGYPFGARKFSQNVEGDSEKHQASTVYKEYMEMLKKEYEKVRRKNDELEKENKELRDLLMDYRRNLESLRREKTVMHEKQASKEKFNILKCDCNTPENIEKKGILLLYLNRLEEKLKKIEAFSEKEKKLSLNQKSELKDSLESQEFSQKSKIALLEQRNEILVNEYNKSKSEIKILRAELDKFVKTKLEETGLRPSGGENPPPDIKRTSDPVSAVSRIIHLMQNFSKS